MSSAQPKESIIDVLQASGEPMSSESIAKAMGVLRHQLNSELSELRRQDLILVNRDEGEIRFTINPSPNADTATKAKPTAGKNAQVVSLVGRGAKTKNTAKPERKSGEGQTGATGHKNVRPEEVFLLRTKILESLDKVPQTQQAISESFGKHSPAALELAISQLQQENMITSSIIINERVYDLTDEGRKAYAEIIEKEDQQESPKATAQAATSKEPEESATIEQQLVGEIKVFVEGLVAKQLKAYAEAAEKQAFNDSRAIAQMKGAIFEAKEALKLAITALDKIV